MENKRTGDTIFKFIYTIGSGIVTFCVIFFKIIGAILLFPSVIIYLIRKRKGETFSNWFNWNDDEASLVAFVLNVVFWMGGIIYLVIYMRQL